MHQFVNLSVYMVGEIREIVKHINLKTE